MTVVTHRIDNTQSTQGYNYLPYNEFLHSVYISCFFSVLKEGEACLFVTYLLALPV